LGAVVSAACLAHDIGNPPLGHSGEKAISEYFLSEKGKEILKRLDCIKKKDFEKFNGNAMGFHILTHSYETKTEAKGGMALTYPTLAAFMKYPRPSCIINEDGKNASEKKMGIFQYDLSNFEEIASELGLFKKDNNRWVRHPLAFLVEAADDICNKIIDLEDGAKHKLIKPYS